MSEQGAAFPVIAGLAVGIGFVILFFVMLKPAFTLSDRELISKYSELAQVKYFLEKYPDAKAEVSRGLNGNSVKIVYSVERQVEQPSGLHTGTNTLRLHVYTRPDPYHPRQFELACKVHQGMMIGWTFADTGAMDEADKTCFYGDYPRSSGGPERYPTELAR